MSILPIITPPFVIALALVVLFGRTGLVTGWLERIRHPALALDLRPARRDDRAAADVHADRVHDPARRARRDQPGAGGSGADAARLARPRVPHGDLAAAAAGARQRPSCWASSRASPTSAIRSCSPATSTCCRRRSSSPSPARSTTRAARRCWRRCCSRFTLVAFWLQQRWLGRASYVTVSGKGDGGIPAQLPRGLWYSLLRHRRRLDRVHDRLLRRHPDRRLRQGHRPRRHDAHAAPFRRRLRHRLGRARAAAAPARPGTASSTPSRSPPSPRR